MFTVYKKRVQSLLAGMLVCGLGASSAKAIDPQMQAVLDELAALNPKPIETLSAEDAREQPGVADAAAKLLKKQDKSTKPEPVKDVDDRKIDGPAGNIPIRVYTPEGDGPFPAILYFHGGGFVIATNDTYDASARSLANLTKAVVVSVEYRKAPENKFPAAVDDAFASYKWLRANAGSLKVDANKIAVAGESAGGNLATVTALRAKEEGIPLPVFQLLVYPLVSDDMNSPSYQQYADAKPLNKPMMGWFFKNYLADSTAAKNPHVTPLHADVAGLPPALIIAAEIDPLTSEGKLYADHLKKAGVPVEYKLYEGTTHEFFGLGAVVDKAQVAQTDAAKALKTAFDAAGPRQANLKD